METNNINYFKSKYKQVHNFFTKRLTYLVIIIISILFTTKIISTQTKLDIDDSFMIEKIRLSGEFQKKLNSITHNDQLDVKILNGTIDNKENIIISTNNLASYKGFILPQKSFLYRSNDLDEIIDFKTDQYEISKLENLIENLIFINLENTNKLETQNTQLPLNENIENTFYTQCIHQSKVFNQTCNHYIKNFLNYFFIYKIEDDFDGLLNIFQKFKNSKHKKDFCEGIQKYTIYSKSNDQNIKNILNECGENYSKFFQDFNGFLEIQEQLNKGYISPLTYKNSDLNSYKLLSFQQIIYNDLQQNIVDTMRIESYSNFLKEIIKNTNNIDSVYIDIIYWFNRYYLLEKLNENKYKAIESKKNQIENTIKTINNIQNGSDLDGLIGLKKLLNNKDLAQTIETKENIPSLSSKQELILNNLKSLSFLKILNEKFLKDDLKINGYFTIQQGENINIIYILFVIDQDGNISEINIGEHHDLNEIVQNMVSQKNTNISEVYQYIKDNFYLYLSTDKASTCDLIKGKFEYYQKNDKQIKLLQLENCNDSIVEITKEEEIENYIKEKIEYKIYMDNFTINKVQISNKILETEINKYLENIKSNHISLPNIVQEIISYKIKDIKIKQEGSNKIIIAIEDFKEFLDTNIHSVFENNGKITIEFQIKDIKLIGHYDTTTKELSPILFKYNPENNKDIDNTTTQKDLQINNFTIILNKENENEINKFILNPLYYIGNKDPEATKKYQNLKYK